ncbi:MAG: serine hydrolase domain-containing protein [Actinomycetes bacterium]
MPTIQATVDPHEVGLDALRLERISQYLSERFLDPGYLAGYLAVVSRAGQVAWVGSGGQRDLAAGARVEADTLWRIYSMTKPITTVAAMVLVERGQLHLKDPVSRYIPAFADARVYDHGSADAPVTKALETPMLIWHLLTHTAGLVYGFNHAHVVDEMYRAAGYDFGSPKDKDLAGVCDEWAALPLQFEPGSAWVYSVATDVLGRIIEVITGKSLDLALRELVLDPLAMKETDFYAPADKTERLAELYIPDQNLQPVVIPSFSESAKKRPRVLSGGGGLVSTAFDYQRFMDCMLAGGVLDGVRVLSPNTVAYMTRNHLPENADLETIAQDSFSETNMAGVGFGLGFSVVVNAAASKLPMSEGTHSWGGAASTTFFIDPKEELTFSFFTQLLPSDTHPIRERLAPLVYQAIVA